MEQRRTLLLSHIKKHLLKRYVLSVFVSIFVIIFILYALVLKGSESAGKILGASCCLLGACMLCKLIYDIYRIQQNAFTVRNDILIRKREHIFSFAARGGLDRLYFQEGHYNLHSYNRNRFALNPIRDKLTGMTQKEEFDTADINDSFTLICDKKSILLAFNNKFFAIENDL